jgi:predicted acetyltransferase
VAYEIVPVTVDNMEELHRVAHTAFLEHVVPERVDDEKLVVEHERMIAVADGRDVVATAGAYSFDLTVPGNETTPMAGVTWVACLPSHRRRGILRQMMQHQLDDVAARGEAIAGLTASEAVIYNRFGYGVASQYLEAKLQKSRVELLVAVSTDGRMRMVWGSERPKVLPPIFDDWRRQRAGSVQRSDGRWEQILRDREFERHGATALFCAVHEDASGRPDGYVAYRVRESEAEHESTLIVKEVIAIDPGVEAALWRFVFDIDLIDRFELDLQPVDSSLPWRLVDKRAYRTTGVWDMLWICVIDAVAALEARRYASDGSVVLEIVNPFRPGGAASGRFRLEGGPDGATCRPERSAEADLTMTIDALGSAYLGGVRWSTLAEAGRVSGNRDALRRADAMFATTPSPFCNTPF